MDPYTDREPQDVNILWGRVAALGGALLLAFLFGTWVAGGDEGIDEQQHLQTVEERDRLARENEELQEQIDQLSQGEPPANPPTADNDDEDGDDSDSDSDSGDGDGSDDSDGQSQVYVVRQGDTLSGVAQRFYGSSGKKARERIAEANDLEPDSTLTVGQELTIPPADD